MSSTQRLRVLHLSDTHLFGDGSLHYGVVDATEQLRRALAHVAGQRFDLVVCSGDVSEDGSLRSYEIARELIVPWAEERGARAVFAMGNHDARASFRAVLGDGQPGADTVSMRTPDALGDSGKAPVESPIVSTAAVNGWRIFVLDTSVPGTGYGSLSADQLEFLRAQLATPVPRSAADHAHHGTVLVMHHPPIAAETDLLQALALGDKDAAALWDVLRGSDVRVILSGHYHMPIFELVEGIPVIVTPGVANVSTRFGLPSEESAAHAFGGTVVEVSPARVRALPFEVPVSTLPGPTSSEPTAPDSAATVFHFDEATVQQIIRAAGATPRF